MSNACYTTAVGGFTADLQGSLDIGQAGEANDSFSYNSIPRHVTQTGSYCLATFEGTTRYYCAVLRFMPSFLVQVPVLLA